MNIPPRLALKILIGIILLITIGRMVSLILSYHQEGQWSTFDSANQSIHPDDPSGFRLNYPTSWDAFFHSGGATKNGKDLRGSFQSPYYWWTSKTYLNIWWRRVDSNWTLQDAQMWFESELGFGINDKEIKDRHNRWMQVEVGKGNYSALVQTYYHTNSAFQFGELPHDEERVVLLIVGDEAFALTFRTDHADAETTAIFQKMLDSFEVYK